MKSLFLRLLVTLWAAMALLVGVFALIHAFAFPPERGETRRRLEASAYEVRGEHALLCLRAGSKDCDRPLNSLEARDQRLALYRSGALVAGKPIEGAEELDARVRRFEGRLVVRARDRELVAVTLPMDPSYTVVASGPVRSRWMFFIMPETLPQRLAAIVAVTGLVAVLLARYLSRPIRVLRQATQEMAKGNLAVRVSDELTDADGETRALGRDMDAMAQRIQALLESERQLRRDISHELRSPLARLNIALELVRRRSPPDVEPAFARIERETERLNAMIGELLDLNRLESDGMQRTEDVDFGTLVQEVVGDAALEAEQKRCRIESELPKRRVVRGNPELLRRAVENVLRNAIRFTRPETAVSVTLAGDGGTSTLTIRDRGPGVPEDALESIFQPFYRVDRDRSRTTGGTGIGLAITQQAVVLHGGKVAAHNHPEEGLVVTIELPEAV